MNIETREIRDLNDITPAERASGKWVPVAGTVRRTVPPSRRNTCRSSRSATRITRASWRRTSAGRVVRSSDWPMSASHPSDAELSRRQRCDARLESDAVPAFDADGESIQYRGPEIPGAVPLPVPAQEAVTLPTIIARMRAIGKDPAMVRSDVLLLFANDLEKVLARSQG